MLCVNSYEKQMIKVVLVEGSVTQREIIAGELSEDGDIEVVAMSADGKEGLKEVLRLKPNVVVSEVWMQEMDGLEMTQAILRELGVPIVILTTPSSDPKIDVTFECLRAGAVHIMNKPNGVTLVDLSSIGAKLRDVVRIYSGVRILKRRPIESEPECLQPVTRSVFQVKEGAAPKAIGIAVSSGGPAVLAEILVQLPADFPIPIFLVQHISQPFEDSFVKWLRSEVSLPVRIAKQGEPVQGGITLGPCGKHITIDSRYRILLIEAIKGDQFCPSCDNLLRSLSDVYGSRVLAIILSGMGTDGVEGMRVVFHTGGQTIAQDENTAMIWGMPGEAVKSGVVQQQLTPLEIAQTLVGLNHQGETR